MRTAPPRRSGLPTWSSTTRRATRSRPRPARGRARLELDEDALSSPALRVPARRRAPPPRQRAVPALGARDRRPARPRRGQGLQADRPGALALGQHRPHPPAQRLPQDRRRRPRPGGPHRPRPRLDLGDRYSIRRGAARSRPHGRGRGLRGGRATAFVWVRTVSAVSPSRSATPSVERPSASSWRVSRWRRVSAAAPLRRSRRGSTKFSESAAASTAASSVSEGELFATYAVAPASSASLAAWRSGRAAVGDDPEARPRLAQRPDRRDARAAPSRRSPAARARRSRRRTRRAR